MSQADDPSVVMFLSTLDEASFRGANPARIDDEPDDFVKKFCVNPFQDETAEPF